MTATLARNPRVERAIAERRSAIGDARQLVETGLELISVEDQWTKLVYARDCYGEKVSPGNEHPAPAAWCLLGCIWEAEYRFVARRTRRRQLAPRAVIWPQSRRLTVALTATWVGCERAFYGAAGQASTLKDALAFEPEYLESLPGQICLLNDRPETRHIEVCSALEIAEQLIGELDGDIDTPRLRPETQGARN